MPGKPQKRVCFDKRTHHYENKDARNMEMDDFEDNVVVRLLSVGLNLATDTVGHR